MATRLVIVHAGRTMRKLPRPSRMPKLPRLPKLPRPPRMSELPPPPGPFRPEFWRSPLRGPWLTSMLGSLLFPMILLVALTGLISHDNYRPDLGHNRLNAASDIFVLIKLPANSPTWLYALTQGLHITVGLIALPVLLAKLWSVIPRLFSWPPVKNPAAALERLSLLLLVGGALFEFATGIINTQDYYPWHFNFVLAHYYGAWVFMSAFFLHVAVKLPTIRKAYRTRGVLLPLRDDLAHTVPEPAEPGGLAPVAPAAPTLSRRGLLAMVGGASLTLFLVNFGESAGGPFRRLALLAPRGRVFGTGPNDFQVNKTAVSVGITEKLAGPGWRLHLKGAKTMSLSREQLLAMPLHSHDLTIGCVEGWSTTQRWTGVLIRDLATLAGAPHDAEVTVESIQPAGPYRHVTLSNGQLDDAQALLALRVNGVELSMDHGYPARLIAPAIPGVHCQKWVGSMTFATE
jgi:DMSO/TMAO reductase YedYZ molybdopterin-dependent catalytic subunit